MRGFFILLAGLLFGSGAAFVAHTMVYGALGLWGIIFGAGFAILGALWLLIEIQDMRHEVRLNKLTELANLIRELPEDDPATQEIVNYVARVIEPQLRAKAGK